ncbi:MAG: hypothetical protein J1D77_01010 [Muribaculaceae bacterium]|nr:hypothetical protein [Muribaculaceae bacterium]
MKAIKPAIILVFFLLLPFLFSGCRPHSTLEGEEFLDLGFKGLIQFYQYEFRPFSEMPENFLANHKCDISIVVRFSERCKIKSLPLKAEYLLATEENVRNKTIEIPLFNDSDIENGKGNFGLYEVEYPLIEDVVVDDCCFIALSTWVPDSQGVIAMGLKWNFKKANL